MAGSSLTPLICTDNYLYQSFKNWNTFRNHLLTCESKIRRQKIALIYDLNINSAAALCLGETSTIQEVSNDSNIENEIKAL